LFVVSSCSASWHVKKAERHAKKAEFKSPGILTNIQDSTLLINVTIDTTIDSSGNMIINHHYDSTYHHFTYQKYDFSEFKNWWETLQENKTERTEIRNERKTDQTQIRQNNKTERTKTRQENKTQRGRSWWWLWLSIGTAVGLLLRFGWNYLKSYLRLHK